MKKFFWLYLCCSAIFPFTLAAADDDNDNEPQTASKSLKTTAAQQLIVLDKTAQLNSGLKTVRVKQVNYRPELLSYGMSLSIEPLLSAQNQYLTTQAQQSGAAAKATFNRNNLTRLSYLHKEGIVASRVLQEQQSTLQVDKAALDSSHYLSQQIINNTRLVWGTVLTDWMIKGSPAFTDLIQQRATLLKITLPADSGINNGLNSIFVAPTGHREQAIVARLISAAPQTDNFSQGQQYFYQVPASAPIKAGMRVSAWLPTRQHAETGVIIPESALTWHLGQALVFVKVAEQQFSHRPISAYHKVAGGYFVGSTIKAGEEIVSSGAQMLLSQEFKGQIPSEDDD